MSSKWNNIITYSQPVTSTMLWAGVFIIAELAVDVLNLYFIAAYRYIVASLFLIGWLYFTSKKSFKIDRKMLKPLCLTAFTGVFLYNAFFFAGLKYSLVTHGVAFMAMIPIWTAILSAFLLKEEITFQKIIGIFLSLAGVFVIIGPNLFQGDITQNMNSILLGDFLLIIAALSMAAYSVQSKKVMAAMSPLVANTYVTIIGTVFLCLYALFDANIPEQISRLTLNMHMGMIYMGVFGTAVAYCLWYSCIDKVGACRTTIFANLVPLWGVLFAAIFLNEEIHWYILIAMVMIISGVFLVQSSRQIIKPLRHHKA